MRNQSALLANLPMKIVSEKILFTGSIRLRLLCRRCAKEKKILFYLRNILPEFMRDKYLKPEPVFDSKALGKN